MKRAADALAAGNGPTGVDAERASGYRYGAEAYLVQMYRRGAGTFLFDPTAIENFTLVGEALADSQWILHAATQDLSCLEALDLRPPKLFDTELASRLLGFEKVGLGSIVEELLGVKLQKAYSSADWSTRPLPQPWLEYAALDVALLPDLRDAIALLLDEQNKTEIAKQEFDAVLSRPQKPVPDEPWRKLTNVSKLRTSRQQTLARELWLARDAMARARDVAPGRLLPDASLIIAAAMNPRSKGELAANKEFRGRASRTEIDTWWKAILRGKTAEPPAKLARDPKAMPPHRSWATKAPEAAARLAVAREAIGAEAQRQRMPVENLLTPDTMRRLVWQPPSPATPEAIAERLRSLGARDWQVVITAPILANVFVDNQ